jgi:hypothetical protein
MNREISLFYSALDGNRQNNNKKGYFCLRGQICICQWGKCCVLELNVHCTDTHINKFATMNRKVMTFSPGPCRKGSEQLKKPPRKEKTSSAQKSGDRKNNIFSK